MLIIISRGKVSSTKFIKDSICQYAKIFNKQLSPYTIVKELDKKPIMTPPDLHFNISHSGEYTLIAISEKKVGIDIQQHKPISYDIILNRFFHKNDKAQTLKEFYDLWTAKEAFIKHSSYNFYEGLKTDINHLEISNIDILDNYSIAIKSDDNDYIFKFNF